ncbi:hypothetical protein fHeYen901_173 [Yersinia phage fHe-Yen9-01]|uniref:Baseplate wedge subunit n=1 Tax=Yersinia phage fHe-Yen9-01 TaxID=1965363 RepID=A0A1V0DXR4_9CAUD|nr:baseplate wedge subunit [Yersinia phage fHe-Yen9-01]ARB05946.1 hypothetical protein fHeYen901_173 [Yersinia phage fHe-Yen9-01]
MLFSFFDPVAYTVKTLDPNAPAIPMADIFKNYGKYFSTVAKGFKLQTHYISGYPRPEELAYRLYGNVQYYWLVLMINNIYDPYYGWITSQDAAYQAAEQRYKDIGGDQVLYHIDILGEKYYDLVEYPIGQQVWYSKGDKTHTYPQYKGALAAVDIYEDAILKNEAKRAIKILNPNDLDTFINQLTHLMGQGQ